MNNTIDYTLDEIIDELHAHKNNITKAINSLENKYFKDRYIFRNAKKGSKHLFRYEIKELLVMLVKLEMDSIFSDTRSSKAGVSPKNIEKIKDSYNKFSLNIDNNAYYSKYLRSQYNINNAIRSTDTLQKFSDSLSNFTMLVTRHYNEFASDFFIDMIDQLDEWSRKIVAHCNTIKEIKKCQSIPEVSIEIDKESNAEIYHPERDGKPCLNLQNAIVRTINEIALVLYRIDTDGVYHRVALDDVVEFFYDDNKDKDKLKAEAKECYEQYAEVCDDSKDKFMKGDNRYQQYSLLHYLPFLARHIPIKTELEQRIVSSVKLDDVYKEDWQNERNRIISEANVILDKIFTNISSFRDSIKYKKELPYKSSEADVNETLQEYLALSYDINKKINNNSRGITQNEIGKLVELCGMLKMYHKNGVEFASYFQNAEKEAYSKAKEKKWGLTTKQFTRNIIPGIAGKAIKQFSEKVKYTEQLYKQESTENKDKKLKDTELSYISSNASTISKLCDDIAANMFSMILRIEYENFEKHDLYSKPFKDGFKPINIDNDTDDE